MPIDVMLAKGKMSVGEFAGRVGIASADRPQRPRRLVVPVR
jgi:DNA-binding Xre family transcriptional regulator